MKFVGVARRTHARQELDASTGDPARLIYDLLHLLAQGRVSVTVTLMMHGH